MGPLTDYLSLEAGIIERLQQRVRLDGDQPIEVLAAADLDGVQESGQRVPALHVLYEDYRPVESQGRGLITRSEQYWTVVVVVRNVRDRAHAGARSQAGPLMIAVLTALQGWRPDDQHTALVLTNPRYRAGYRNGYAYFPITVTTQVQTTGDRS